MALAYPRWITRADGAQLIVPDEEQHASHMLMTVEELRASLEPQPEPAAEPEPDAADPLGIFTDKKPGRRKKAEA